MTSSRAPDRSRAWINLRGKSWLACALGHKACREDFSVLYHRMPRLFMALALAQTYPNTPVRLIVPFAPGGSNDVIAHLIGQWLSERLGQPFIIES